ncbi:MAG: DNA topoisomerase I [Desulfurococcaceae archaeon]
MKLVKDKVALERERSQFVSLWDLKGRILIIAEKPKASRKIAEAISANPIVHRFKNIPYYEIKSGVNTILVASAAGHLYGLYTDVDDYPVFEYKWISAYLVNEDKRYTKDYLELLKHLSKGCDYYINACDYDIEGSVIGYLIIKFMGDEKRAFRAKFSSLVPSELRSSLSRLLPLDYNMIEAGLCRHELDWLWGINISRALMKAVRSVTGSRVVLSVGRVQTPTLKYVVERTLERKLFIPLPQYVISVVLRKNNVIFTAELTTNPINNSEEANRVAQVVSKYGYLVVRDVSTSRFTYSPPPPFNLSDLQEEAAAIYGFSPMETQNIAEQLYLEALISYPRTNSQKLPPGLNYREILLKLSSLEQYSNLVQRLLIETRGVLKPVEGEKEDPAHPAIYPTGYLPKSLTKKQWAIYDLVVRRFFAAFAPPAVITRTKMVFSTPRQEFMFEATGLTVESLGWLRYYPFHKPGEKVLPKLSSGDIVEVIKVRVREVYSKPPSRLRKIDVLRWMENVGIGTESTRAPIIEKLFDRKYLVATKSGVDVTDLGYGVIEVVDKFFPDLASVELTRKFEVLLNEVMNKRKTREQVIESAKVVIKDLIERFNANLANVGEMLSKRLDLLKNYEKCIIPNCKRDVYIQGLCKYHYRAHTLLNDAYKEWFARKKIQYRDYLEKLLKLKSTGEYIKDVIQYVVLKDASKTTKNDRRRL